MEVEFHRAGQVRVARARRCERAARVLFARKILNRQGFLPVGPIPVFDAQGDRSANRLPVPNPCQRLDAVLFDFLAPAAAVSQLPPVQFHLHKLEVNGHTRGQAADPRNQRLTVRLTRSNKAKHGRLRILSDQARRVKWVGQTLLSVPDRFAPTRVWQARVPALPLCGILHWWLKKPTPRWIAPAPGFAPIAFMRAGLNQVAARSFTSASDRSTTQPFRSIHGYLLFSAPDTPQSLQRLVAENHQLRSKYTNKQSAGSHVRKHIGCNTLILSNL